MKSGNSARFADRAVIVTGGASGIGLETARAFAREGARVVAIDVNPDGEAHASAELGDLASRVSFCVGDVGTQAGCRSAVDTALNELGGLDVLCNIAGYSELVHFADVQEAALQRIMAVNVGGVFFMTQAAMPALLESEGAVVNMASVAGLVGNPYNSTYCATKAAVVNLTRALAIEYSKRGVRLNCVCPGSVLTPATQKTKMPDDLDTDLFRFMIPPLGHCQPDEIAEAVLYLASEAARYVTGTALAIDGGRSAA